MNDDESFLSSPTHQGLFIKSLYSQGQFCLIYWMEEPSMISSPLSHPKYFTSEILHVILYSYQKFSCLFTGQEEIRSDKFSFGHCRDRPGTCQTDQIQCQTDHLCSPPSTSLTYFLVDKNSNRYEKARKSTLSLCSST